MTLLLERVRRRRLSLISREDTWTHVLGRLPVPWLLKVGVSLNQVMAAKLASGLGAIGAITVSGGCSVGLFSVFWIVSGLLDRIGGELARVSCLKSRAHCRYDLGCDLVLNSSVFIAIGWRLRDGTLLGGELVLGLAAAAGVVVCLWASEVFERRKRGRRIWGKARYGFHRDDALLMLAPAAWLGWLPGVLTLLAAASGLIACVIGFRLAAGPYPRVRKRAAARN